MDLLSQPSYLSFQSVEDARDLQVRPLGGPPSGHNLWRRSCKRGGLNISPDFKPPPWTAVVQSTEWTLHSTVEYICRDTLVLSTTGERIFTSQLWRRARERSEAGRRSAWLRTSRRQPESERRLRTLPAVMRQVVLVPRCWLRRLE